MHRRLAAIRRGLRLVAVLPALGFAACAHRSTKPAAPLVRTTTVTVTDSLGGTTAGEPVWLLDLDAVAPAVFPAYTDPQGRVSAQLEEGPWLVYVRVARTCAGCTFGVPGASRPRSDTVDVRLRLLTESWLTGRVSLAGLADDSGTLCLLEGRAGDPVLTDAAGIWLMDGVPPGTWTLAFTHTGFGGAIRSATVPAAGDTVIVPDLTLSAPVP